MKEFKNIKIIGIDHGYGNIKTANTVTPTSVSYYDSRPMFSGNILEMNGKYYKMGERHKEFIESKTKDEDFYLLTLMAIAKELNIVQINTADVYLAVGLPLTWVRRQREEFAAYLMKNQNVDFRFNEKEYHIHLIGCSVYPQGYAAIINRLGEMKGTNFLADIGNGTMNFLYFDGKRPLEKKAWTELAGVNQCVILAKSAVMNQYGSRIPETLVEEVLRKGTAEIASKYLTCIQETAKLYVEGLFRLMREHDYNPDLMKLYITGGGGCLVRHFGNIDPERVVIVDDIRANARGYEFLACEEMKRKGES